MSVSTKIARAIMGESFIGVEEAIRYFGVQPTEAQRTALHTVPFTEETLRLSDEEHVLVATFPLSILEIEAIHRISNDPIIRGIENPLPFMHEPGEVGWHLFEKRSGASENVRTEFARIPLSKPRRPPSVQVMTYAMASYYYLSGGMMHFQRLLRTSSVDENGVPIDVGFIGRSKEDYRVTFFQRKAMHQ